MSQTLRTGFDYNHNQRQNVIIQDLTDWSGETDGMDDVEQEWLSRASQPNITASITEFRSNMSLRVQIQNHLAQEWSEIATEVGIEKIAFVSEGVKRRTVSASLDVPQEIRTFGSVGDAFKWARK